MWVSDGCCIQTLFKYGMGATYRSQCALQALSGQGSLCGCQNPAFNRNATTHLLTECHHMQGPTSTSRPWCPAACTPPGMCWAPQALALTFRPIEHRAALNVVPLILGAGGLQPAPAERGVLLCILRRTGAGRDAALPPHQRDHRRRVPAAGRRSVRAGRRRRRRWFALLLRRCMLCPGQRPEHSGAQLLPGVIICLYFVSDVNLCNERRRRRGAAGRHAPVLQRRLPAPNGGLWTSFLHLEWMHAALLCCCLLGGLYKDAAPT